MTEDKYSKDKIEIAVKNSNSFADTIRFLGMEPSGGAHRKISSLIRYYNIDITHFNMLACGWARGKTAESHTSVKLFTRKVYLADSAIFCENSRVIEGPRLTRRLLELGWYYTCAVKECPTHNLTSWCGEKLKLHLDHINGIRNDNRLENLRFLCPNCHQCTPTWGNKGNKVRIKHVSSPILESDLVRSSKKEKVVCDKPCKRCQMPVKDFERTYCSIQCFTLDTAKAKNKITKEELEKLVENESLTQIGKRYNVSPNTVKNWCVDYSIPTHGVGYWAKRRAEEQAAQKLITSLPEV